MVRKLLAAVFCVGICLGLATADEFKGKVKSVDADKKTITVDVDGKEMKFAVTADTKITAGKKDVPDGLAAKVLSKAGVSVTVTTAEGKADTATAIKISGKKKTN